MNLVDALTDPSNLLTVFIAVVVFATIITLTSPLMRNSNLEGRLKSVANRREELRRRSRQTIAARGGGTCCGPTAPVRARTPRGCRCGPRRR